MSNGLVSSSTKISADFIFKKEVAVGERIAYWIRTPQVPGSRPGWYGTFY